MKNNLFALKIIAKNAPLYMVTYLSISVIDSLLDFFSSTFLFRTIINDLTLGRGIEHILVYIAVIASLQLVYKIFESWVTQCVWPRQRAKINAALNKMLFEKSAQVELACYETPEFYDKYVKAMDGGLTGFTRFWARLTSLSGV